MKILEGKLTEHNIRIAIVASRFNEFITSRLLSGALDGLKRHDVKEENIHVDLAVIACGGVGYASRSR